MSGYRLHKEYCEDLCLKGVVRQSEKSGARWHSAGTLPQGTGPHISFRAWHNLRSVSLMLAGLTSKRCVTTTISPGFCKTAQYPLAHFKRKVHPLDNLG